MLYSISDDGKTAVKKVENINAYLVAAADVIVKPLAKPIDDRPDFISGNVADDDGQLIVDSIQEFGLIPETCRHLVRPFVGSFELINGKKRYCIWVEDEDLELAKSIDEFAKRFDKVRKKRSSPAAGPRAKEAVDTPHQFAFRSNRDARALVIPRVSSEGRPFLPIDLIEGRTIIGDRNFALYDADLWNMALIASRLHWVWIGTVCVRLEMRFSYSNTLGWNTFPVPLLTEQNKADLTRCAEDILLAREAHFPATIADLYDPETMPDNLRHAHERNDEVLERIYIGRRFKNDTERLEKLFELYTKMTAVDKAKPAVKATRGRKKTV